VVLGRSDGKRTEILQGPGRRAVRRRQQLVLKAELGKDSAEHAH
jgi:cobalt-zinc-cadmium efflux system membrane fusion protein